MSNGDDFDFGDMNFEDSGIDTSGGDLFGGGDEDLFSNGQNQQGQANGNPLNSPDVDFFDDSNIGDNQTEGQTDNILTKKYIIVAVAGLVFVLIAIFIGSRILGKKNNADTNNVSNTNVNNRYTSSTNANEILGTKSNQNVVQNTQQSSSSQDINIKYQKDENGFSWMEVTDSEDISYEEDYIQKTFSIDRIKHYARKADADGTLVIKTVLSGSLSGMPGTYTIEVPYSKGVRLSVHTSFTVNVLFGEYNEKIVVVDITY